MALYCKLSENRNLLQIPYTLFYDRQKLKMENVVFMEEIWTLSSNPTSSLDQRAKKLVSDNQGPVDVVFCFLGIQFPELNKCLFFNFQ